MLKKTFVYKLFYNTKIKRQQDKVLSQWNLTGNPLPPPHEYKQHIITHLSSKIGISTFIETGTFLGFMIEIMRYRFKKIVSIELDQNLFEKAKAKFLTEKNITILQGDSSKILPIVLIDLHEPALFWLDGHYSEGITAKGKLNTPIVSELKSILEHPIKDHLILIDDARCFVGIDDYPTVEELRTLVLKYNPALNFNVKNDIIVICNSIPQLV